MTRGWRTIQLKVETIDRLEEFRIHKGGLDEAINYALDELEINKEQLREFLIREEPEVES